MKLFNEVNWYGRAMARYAVFSGRATRAEFWYFTLVSGLMGVGAALIDDASRLGDILYLLVTLVHALPSVSVLVRRLHDTGRSGWWFWALFTVVGVIPVFVFLCQRSTPAPNRYGPELGAPGKPASSNGAPGRIGPEGIASRDPIGELERLAELHGKGALTDVEFARLKARVVGPADVSPHEAIRGEIGRVEPRL